MRRVDCESVSEFLEQLAGPDSPDAIFRGESDMSRELLPKAFRQDGLRALGKYTFGSVAGDGLRLLQYAEGIVLCRFYTAANEQGLVLPFVSQELHQQLIAREVRWPSDELVPLAALAQHYGLPTRLLDWSEDRYAAAYFAASRGIKYQSHDGRRIGVFVLRYLGSKSRVRVVRVPFAGNPNLAAQRGCFTIVDSSTDRSRREDHFTKHNEGDYDKWTETVVREAPWFQHLLDLSRLDDNRIAQITLPVNMSADLLKALRLMGYRRSRMFPGFTSIIDELDEEDELSGYNL